MQITDSIEKLTPEYIAENLILPEELNFRIDSGGKRFYARFANNEVYTAPSVTSILSGLKPGFGLLEFYKNNTAEDIDFISTFSALYGTIFHVLCGKILRAEKIPCSKEYIKEFMYSFCYKENEDYFSLVKFIKTRKRDMTLDLIAFSKWVKDYNVKPIAIEYPVFTKKFAGTIDLVAEIDLKKKITKSELIESAKNKFIEGFPNGLTITKIRRMKKKELLDLLELKETNRVLAVIDLKSGQNGFFKSHIMQLHAYMKAWNIEQKENKVTHIFNYGNDKFNLSKIRYRFTDQTDNAQVFKEWDCLLKMFYLDPSNYKIKGRYEINRSSLDVTDSDNIIYVDPVAKIKEYIEMEAF